VLVNPYTDLWYLIVVDSDREIPADYVPELTEVASSGKYMDARVAPYYNDMYAAAKKDGITLTPYSGYRSYARQERNYNNKISYYESLGYSEKDAAVKAATIIMPPGSSEHNLGYAMDIVCVEEWFETTDEYKWLTENAADYGFILRYPKHKQDITKVTYEPWHWRYVGVEAAKEMKATDQVLEEYLGAQ
jgi:D-alanyl-D-alanine carboxypeptidase